MMYAIAFDLDRDLLQANYHNSSFNNAYKTIEATLGAWGFTRQQGSLYFGHEQVTAVDCVLAIMDLTAGNPWFKPSVKDVRMLRVEDDNNLMTAVDYAIEHGVQPSKYR